MYIINLSEILRRHNNELEPEAHKCPIAYLMKPPTGGLWICGVLQ